MAKSEAQISQIIFCPCCCSTEDLITTDGAEETLECTSCGQSWTMQVSEARFDAFAPAG